MGAIIQGRWKLFIYVIILMTAFNSFSHGTQDIYPTFLQVQQKYPPKVVSTMAVIYNLGAIFGGLVFGAFSEYIGRRRAIVTAALLTLPVIPLWAFSNNVVLLSVGAFLLQFFVQGAWGVIPVHLNELSPDSLQGTFPGFTRDTQLQIQSRVKSLDRSSRLSYTKRILPPMKRAIYYRAAGFSSTVAIVAPPELTYCDFLSGRQRVQKTGRRGIDWSQV